MSNKDVIKKFIEKRPKVIAAYGYGSGVFKQAGYNGNEEVQLDLIFIVEDIKKWHLENMKKILMIILILVDFFLRILKKKN